MSWFLKGFKLSQGFLNIINTHKPLLKFLKANLIFIVQSFSKAATASSYVFSTTVTSNYLVTFLSN